MAYIKLYKEFAPEVRENIVFKVINRNKHKELLNKVPYIEYLDLAIVFYYYLPDQYSKEGERLMMINNEMIEMWQADISTLMEAAICNTPRIFGFKFRGILNTIASFLEDDSMLSLVEDEENYTPIYVATNNIAFNGAAVMLYKDALKAIASKLKSDLYIIPSSIHEIIVVKTIEGCEFSTDAIKEMIYNINRNELPPEDFLSDNLYFYNRKTGELGIA